MSMFLDSSTIFMLYNIYSIIKHPADQDVYVSGRKIKKKQQQDVLWKIMTCFGSSKVQKSVVWLKLDLSIYFLCIINA